MHCSLRAHPFHPLRSPVAKAITGAKPRDMFGLPHRQPRQVVQGILHEAFWTKLQASFHNMGRSPKIVTPWFPSTLLHKSCSTRGSLLSGGKTAWRNRNRAHPESKATSPSGPLACRPGERVIYCAKARIHGRAVPRHVGHGGLLKGLDARTKSTSARDVIHRFFAVDRFRT